MTPSHGIAGWHAALPALAAGMGLYAGGLGLFLQRLRRREAVAARLSALRTGGAAARPGAAAPVPLPVRPVVWVGAFIARSGLLSRSTLDQLRHTLRIAGLDGPTGLATFVGAKLLLMTFLPLLVLFAPRLAGLDLPQPVLWAAAAMLVGLLLPDHLVRRQRARYLTALDRGLPDALDMLVICAEAGLGLEAGLERVSVEARHAHPAIAQELTQTMREMQMSPDRRIALLNLGARTGLPALVRVTGALAQSLQFGTPLSQALRTLAAELRQDMLTRYEERAARLPVLLTMPMIMFILPCVFLIVAGPAILRAMQTVDW